MRINGECNRFCLNLERTKKLKWTTSTWWRIVCVSWMCVSTANSSTRSWRRSEAPHCVYCTKLNSHARSLRCPRTTLTNRLWPASKRPKCTRSWLISEKPHCKWLRLFRRRQLEARISAHQSKNWLMRGHWASKWPRKPCSTMRSQPINKKWSK